MRLVVGLGNPGSRYEGTRHNAGFRVVETLARRWNVSEWRSRCRSLIGEALLGSDPVVLARPQTYMNRSGVAVRLLLQATGAETSGMLVIHDDLDLPLGRLRIRTGGGHGGHNGLRSILENIGTGEFPRLKIGIGRPPEGGDAVEHVLSAFAADEAAELPEVLEKAADAAVCLLVEGPLQAMNRFNG